MTAAKTIALCAVALCASVGIGVPSAHAQFYGAYGRTYNNPMSASADRLIQNGAARRRLKRRLAKRRAAKQALAQQRASRTASRRSR